MLFRNPRRVLTQLSLATAMYERLSNSTLASQEHKLHEMLQEYGQDGFLKTDGATITAIKLALNELMAATIKDQDVIVCTLSAAAKDNLALNFTPVVVILDEAARVTELKSLIPLRIFQPLAFIFAGDHIQQPPYCASYGREKNKVSPYLNPFGSQPSMSSFERMIPNGAEHSFLIQHRCMGDISELVSKTFYQEDVQPAPIQKDNAIHVAQMQALTRSSLGAKVPTNRYVRNLWGSRSQKEAGGTSQINLVKVSAIMDDLKKMVASEIFIGKSIAVMGCYKGQMAVLKPLFSKLNLQINIIDLSALTVAVSHVTEYNVVLLSLI